MLGVWHTPNRGTRYTYLKYIKLDKFGLKLQITKIIYYNNKLAGKELRAGFNAFIWKLRAWSARNSDEGVKPRTRSYWTAGKFDSINEITVQ